MYLSITLETRRKQFRQLSRSEPVMDDDAFAIPPLRAIMTDVAGTSRAQTYVTHLNSVLLPALDAVRRNLAQVEQDIAE